MLLTYNYVGSKGGSHKALGKEQSEQKQSKCKYKNKGPSGEILLVGLSNCYVQVAYGRQRDQRGRVDKCFI